MVSKVKEVSQLKPRLGQGRAGLRCKIKSPTISPLMQAVDKSSKIPEVSKIQDNVMTIPNFTMPPVGSKGKSSTYMIDRKMIHDIGGFPSTQIQFKDPLLSQKSCQYLKVLETCWILTQN